MSISALLAVDDVGHDKSTVFKVKALEAMDKEIGQLARLLRQAESSGKFQYSLCVIGDHSTPVEYGDHNFEPVPFTLCRLKDFVGGEEVLMGTSLEPFPLPIVKVGEDLTCDSELEERKVGKQLKPFNGDSVCEFHEIDAARGFLGIFPGSEMMGIIKTFLKL